MVLIPSPSPTVTTLNRSGRIAFFAIDNRILYSSDSDSVGGFPVSLYKVTQGVFRLKTPKENLSLVASRLGTCRGGKKIANPVQLRVTDKTASRCAEADIYVMRKIAYVL